MIVFLDESGVHLGAGHSVVAIVYVENSNIDEINDALQRMATDIAAASLHWKDMAWVVRAKVFRVVSKLPFHFQIAIFNNPIGNVDQVISQVLGDLLVNYDENISAIYIDGAKSQKYESRLKKTLRNVGVKTVKLRTVDDSASPGVQIADLLAGLYRHQLDKPSPASARLQRAVAKKQIV